MEAEWMNVEETSLVQWELRAGRENIYWDLSSLGTDQCTRHKAQRRGRQNPVWLPRAL